MWILVIFLVILGPVLLKVITDSPKADMGSVGGGLMAMIGCWILAAICGFVWLFSQYYAITPI